MLLLVINHDNKSNSVLHTQCWMYMITLRTVIQPLAGHFVTLKGYESSKYGALIHSMTNN